MKPPKNNVKKTPKTQIKKLIFLFNFQEKKNNTDPEKKIQNPEKPRRENRKNER
jgi:hypothetical protein